MMRKIIMNNIKEKEFCIIIPSFNNEKYIHQNLQSALSQNYSNFTIRYINDASTDQTGKIADEYARRHSKMEVRHNNKNEGAMCNLFCTFEGLKDNCIGVCLDGDDALCGVNVLTILNQVYNSGEIYWTWGSYQNLSNGKRGCSAPIAKKAFEDRSFASYPWSTSHLRTCMAKAFKKIDRNNLMYNGRFAESAWDVCICLNLLYMFGADHCKYIDEILLSYNDRNPISDDKKDLKLQQTIDAYFRANIHPEFIGKL